MFYLFLDAEVSWVDLDDGLKVLAGASRHAGSSDDLQNTRISRKLLISTYSPPFRLIEAFNRRHSMMFTLNR